MRNYFFSVAIPTYEFQGKGTKYLTRNFEILSRQTFKNFEIIVSDDSKNSEIKNLCDEWSDVLNITHYFNPPHNYNSHSPNINNALSKCSGEWVKILFQDDFLYDEKSLETQYEIINKNENLYWFFTKFYHSSDDGDLYNLYTPRWNDDVWSGDNTLGGPSGLTVKNERIPKFDESLIFLMDCDFYQKLFLQFGAPRIFEEITVVNKSGSDQLTHTIEESTKLKDLKIVKQKYDKSI
jgi:glycosyltransferase involved in cell wall biosynthesis